MNHRSDDTLESEQHRFFAMGLATYAISVLLMLSFGGLLQRWDVHFGVILSQVLFILGPAMILWSKLPQKPVIIRAISWRSVIWIVLATPCVAFAANALAGIVTELFSAQEMSEQYVEGVKQLLEPEAWWRRVLGIVSICLVAPICEEVLFRGSIFHAQKPLRGFATAAVMNGVFFSLLHVNPIGFVSLVVIGIFFATLTRGGLILAMVAHAILNFTSGVLPMFADSDLTDVESLELKLLVPLFVVFAVLAGYFWRQLWNSLPEEES